MIDGKDAVKRIIELKLKTPVKNNPSNDKCDLSLAGNKIGVAQKVDTSQKVYSIVLYDKDDKQQIADPFNQYIFN